MDGEWTDDVRCAARKVALAAYYSRNLSLTGKVEILNKGPTEDIHRLSLEIPPSKEEQRISYRDDFKVERGELLVSNGVDVDRLKVWMQNLREQVSQTRLEELDSRARFRCELSEGEEPKSMQLRVSYYDRYGRGRKR